MIAGLILMIFVPITIGADLPNCLNQPVGHETIIVKEKSSLTFSNIRAPETLLKVKDYPETSSTTKIEKSYLSHLPLVERSWTHKVSTFEVEDSCLAFLSPPQRKKYEENYQPFLKALETISLKFTRVPFMHAFNWEDVNPEIVDVVDSLFVRIPESFNKMKNLRFLYVRNSGLKWIERDAFKGLFYLRAIDFKDNDIEHLQAGAFQSIKGDINIDLGGNKIMFIDPGAFPDNVYILVLDRIPVTNLDFKGLEGVGVGLMSVCGTSLKCSCVGLENVGLMHGTCLQEDRQRRVWMEHLYRCRNVDFVEGSFKTACQ